jgi:hypothetical protein
LATPWGAPSSILRTLTFWPPFTLLLSKISPTHYGRRRNWVYICGSGSQANF